MRAAALVLAALSLSGCARLIFFPDQIERITPDRIGIDYNDVWLQTSDGVRLHAWHLRAEEPAHGTVLFFHGNAQNNSAHLAAVYWLPAEGFHVFMLDPRGFGHSEGRPTLDGVHIDAAEALRHIADTACNEIIVFGQSLGGAMAVYTVAGTELGHCLRGVVTEGVYAGYRRIAREKLGELWLTWPLQYPLSWLFSDRYSPEPRIGDISPLPLLLMHGDADAIIPPHHGERLYEAAQDPRELWLVPGADHIQALADPAHRARLVEWMRMVLE